MGFNLIRFPVALLLIAAAALKVHHLLSPQVLDYRGLHILLVQAEVALALWLISGVWRREAWVVTMVAFAGFAGFSLLRALGGEESCGCFGALQVNPWLTFTLDLAIVALLLTWPPRPEDEYAPRRRLGVAAVTGVVLLAIAIPSSAAIWRYMPGLILPDGTLHGDPRHVGILPRAWVGQPFPLLNYIEIDIDLSAGSWSIMLFSHRCPACDYALGKLVRSASDHSDREAVGRIVLVSVPPHSDAGHEEVLRQYFHVGRLLDDRRWYVQVPTVIHLQDGIVTQVEPGGYLHLPAGTAERPAS